MKILLIADGTRGDVQPFVVLGRALAARGHHVSVTASNGFAPVIRDAGLNYCALPMDFHELMQTPLLKEALNSFSGKLKALRWFANAQIKEFDAVWSIGLDLQPDLILHHFKSGVAPYVARKLGAIAIPIMLQPGFVPTHDYPQFLIASRSLGRFGNMISHRGFLGALRFATHLLTRHWQRTSKADIGPPMDFLDGYNPNGTPMRIHAYSKAIVPRPDEWPITEIQTGYFFADPQTYQPSDELSAFLAAGPPPVYFGFGSMPGMDPENIATAISGAVYKLGLRAVAATGWGGVDHLKPNANMHILDTVPHSWLFPKVTAVVHHGGSGTTHEALRWGRPSVICPLFADQPFFGERIADLGAGPKPIPQKSLTADNLATALEFALSEPAANRAAQISETMHNEHAVRDICDMVDRGF